MSQSKTIILPDGSRCHTGSSCKRHGNAAQAAVNTAKVEQLQSQIAALLTPTAKNAEDEVELKPEWWNDYQQKNFGYKEEIFQKFGMGKAKVPTFHDNAARYGYIQVETGDKDTQLVVSTDGTYFKHGEKYYCRAWMYKHGKPVAMLHFATYPLGYTPPEGQYPYVESVICDIEVHKDYNGKGYGLEVIRHVEKNILGGRLIHSGGSYTPEGRKSLGGKLPYTHDAKREHKKEFEAGIIPESSFASMEFVHDWDMLQPMR